MHWRSRERDAREDFKSYKISVVHVSGRLLTDNNLGSKGRLHVLVCVMVENTRISTV